MASAHLAYRDREWMPQPAAERALQTVLADLLKRLPDLDRWRQAVLDGTGVRLRDIIDHLRLPRDAAAPLAANGWRHDPTVAGGEVWTNPAGWFPDVVIAEGSNGHLAELWFRVESADDFARANGVTNPVQGREHGPVRRVQAFAGIEAVAGAIARNGHLGYDWEPAITDAQLRAARIHRQAFRARRRQFDSVPEGLAHTERLVDAAVADLGQHWACDIWLSSERDYWMLRSSAGRLQKARQDVFGLGWNNIDHHTYDGSREHFAGTIRLLEKLGYELREMLYAGDMAGWGSQVLEQPVLRSTIFADVDLAPDEVDVDFAHMELPPLPKHRRAGILSLLHGESILECGLNHVAALYDQRALRGQLEREGCKMMNPFSNFPFLYQELTTGDWAAVDPARVDALEASGDLSRQEAEDIRLNGYIATHLENIERNDGYKGFNKPGIDGVLRALDPRAEVRETAVLSTRDAA